MSADVGVLLVLEDGFELEAILLVPDGFTDDLGVSAGLLVEIGFAAITSSAFFVLPIAALPQAQLSTPTPSPAEPVYNLSIFALVISVVNKTGSSPLFKTLL